MWEENQEWPAQKCHLVWPQVGNTIHRNIIQNIITHTTSLKKLIFCAFFETDSSLSTPSASSPTTSVNSPSGNCRDSRIVKYCIQIYFYINANQLKKISEHMNQLLQYMLLQTNCANTLNLTTSVSFLKFWSKYFFSKQIHTRLMLQWLLLQSKVRQCAVKLYIYIKKCYKSHLFYLLFQK